MNTDISSSFPSKSKSFNYWSLIWTVLWILLGVLVILRIFVYQQVNVVGASMEPNYFTDQMLVVDQRNKELLRGQVVAVYEDKTIAKNATYFTRFDAKTKFFLKRVIGLPGEEVEMIGCKVIIYNNQYPNGVVISEDYISNTVCKKEEVTNYYFPRTKVENKNYFLLGDNRTNSTDSRVRGLFPDYTIFGQEVFRYWPLNERAWFKLPDYVYSKVSPELESELGVFKDKFDR